MGLGAFRLALEARPEQFHGNPSESQCLYCLMAVINTSNKSTLREKVFICFIHGLGAVHHGREFAATGAGCSWSCGIHSKKVESQECMQAE